jgi:hypothetical protein
MNSKMRQRLKHHSFMFPFLKYICEFETETEKA